MGTPQREVESAQRSGKIVLFDDRLLRRAGLRALLDRWVAQAQGLELIELSGPADAGPEPANWTMVIVNLGSQKLRDEGLAELNALLEPLAASVPVVIISDRSDQDEIAGTLERGYRGFVPTVTDPSVALRALTFILNGGDFFPPSILLPAAGRPAEEGEDDNSDGANPDGGPSHTNSSFLDPDDGWEGGQSIVLPRLAAA